MVRIISRGHSVLDHHISVERIGFRESDFPSRSDLEKSQLDTRGVIINRRSTGSPNLGVSKRTQRRMRVDITKCGVDMKTTSSFENWLGE